MKRLVIFIIILLFSKVNIWAQSTQFEQDMQRMASIYSAKSNYSMKYDLEVKFDGIINSTLQIETLVADTNSISRIGQNIVAVHGPKHSITINNERKFISVTERRYMDMSGVTGLFSLKDSNCKVITFSCEKSYRCYKLTYSIGELESIFIRVDSTSGMVSQVEYVSRNIEEYGLGHYGKRTTIIRIKEFELRADIPESLFIDKTYFQKMKKELKPLSPYEGYEIFNLNER